VKHGSDPQLDGAVQAQCPAPSQWLAAPQVVVVGASVCVGLPFEHAPIEHSPLFDGTSLSSFTTVETPCLHWSFWQSPGVSTTPGTSPSGRMSCRQTWLSQRSVVQGSWSSQSATLVQPGPPLDDELAAPPAPLPFPVELAA
jgi:hypothetical protein